MSPSPQVRVGAGPGSICRPRSIPASPFPCSSRRQRSTSPRCRTFRDLARSLQDRWWVILPDGPRRVTTPAIFGFFPASGAAPAGAGRQAVGNTPTADGPLGLFAALLQLVGGDDSILPAAQTATAPGTPPPILAVAPETEATEIEEAQPGLLADLADALDALGIGIVADAPLDPVLERQALALVETVAQAAGVPLPVVRVAEAAIAG